MQQTAPHSAAAGCDILCCSRLCHTVSSWVVPGLLVDSISFIATFQYWIFCLADFETGCHYVSWLTLRLSPGLLSWRITCAGLWPTILFFKLKIRSLKCFISSWMSCSSVFVLIICFTRRFQDKVLPPAVHFMMFSSFFKINKKSCNIFCGHNFQSCLGQFNGHFWCFYWVFSISCLEP